VGAGLVAHSLAVAVIHIAGDTGFAVASFIEPLPSLGISVEAPAFKAIAQEFNPFVQAGSDEDAASIVTRAIN
jgi:hypothetical protein